MLNEEFPDRFGYVCSKTTRAAKEGEEAGVHYEYIDKATFESEVANGKFVEHAEIDGELFGTSFEAVQAVHDANKVPIIVADVQGVKSLREVYPRGAFCLVTPSSVDGLEVSFFLFV
jgi:guanylate kinase